MVSIQGVTATICCIKLLDSQLFFNFSPFFCSPNFSTIRNGFLVPEVLQISLPYILNFYGYDVYFRTIAGRS